MDLDLVLSVARTEDYRVRKCEQGHQISGLSLFEVITTRDAKSFP